MVDPAGEIKRIGIVGTGAMGSLVAAHLAPNLDTIVLGTWRDAVCAFNERGVFLEREGARIVVPVAASSEPRAVPPVDLAIVAVKAHQTERAARWVKAILRPDGMAVTLQNGLGNFETLVEHVGKSRAVVGVTMQGSTLLGPAHVYHAGQGPTTLAANGDQLDRLAQIAILFNQSGIDTHLAGDISSLVWGKLVVNCAINALTAIYRVPNGWLAENQEARSLMIAAAQETADVANALGIRLPFGDPGGRVLEVATATASNKSSTLQDVLRGAPTELDRINGAVVRAGKQIGIPTPVNEQLLRIAQNPRITGHRVATLYV